MQFLAMQKSTLFKVLIFHPVIALSMFQVLIKYKFIAAMAVFFREVLQENKAFKTIFVVFLKSENCQFIYYYSL